MQLESIADIRLRVRRACGERGVRGHKVLEAFPIINGKIHSPLDELRKRQQEGIAWPYPPPLE